jgi:DNA polymerase/3'-5' exonuclease PolX
VGKKDAYIDRLRRTLACQSSVTTAAINHNAFLTNPLEELAQKTSAHDDPKGFRRKAYLGAVATLKALTFRVTSLGDVEGLRGISRTGTSVEKIRELLERGTLQRLEEFRANPSRAACAELKTVWGLGDARATELVARGFWSVHQLRLAVRSERAAAGAAGAAAGACSVTLVPAAVERTLEVHEDLQLKIPRAQVPNPPCVGFCFGGGRRCHFFFSLV